VDESAEETQRRNALSVTGLAGVALYGNQLNGRTYLYATIRLDGTDTGLFYANSGNPGELRRKRTSWLDWTVDSVAEMSTGLFFLLLGRFLRRVNWSLFSRLLAARICLAIGG
jgi:hypothetical protein